VLQSGSKVSDPQWRENRKKQQSGQEHGSAASTAHLYPDFERMAQCRRVDAARTGGKTAMVKYLYNLVMESEQNPLQTLPKMVRFQYMVILAYMWSVVFCIYLGTIAVLGPSIAAHTILLIGIFFTGDIFRRARARSLSYDQIFKDPADGTADYDDVWGAPAADMRRAPAAAR
jgi:hypothetical protein